MKVEAEEQEILSRAEPSTSKSSSNQDLNQNFPQAELLMYCPQCGSTLGAPSLQESPSQPPLPAQPRCSLCGQSSSHDILLLEHNYTQDLQSVPGLQERDAVEFHCSVCGQRFGQVGALLEHMSEHLSMSSAATLGFDSVDSEAWSFEDDAFDETPQETICSICGKVFTHPNQLQEHLRTHLR